MEQGKKENKIIIDKDTFLQFCNPKDERHLDQVSKILITVSHQNQKQVKYEFLNHFKELQKSQNQLQLLQHFITIFYGLKRVDRADKFYYYMVIFLIKEFINPLITEQNQQIILSQWTKLPILVLKEILELFQVNNLIDQNFLSQHLNFLICSQKLFEGVGIIEIFGKEYFQNFDFLEIISRFIQFGKIEETEKIVQIMQEPKINFYFVQALLEKHYMEKAFQYCQSFGYEVNQFPELNEWFFKNKLKEISNKIENWEKVEERISYSKIMIQNLAEEILVQNDKNVALSILKRHNISAQSLQIQISDENNFEYVPNRYLEKDGFGNTEQICLDDQINQYIQLSDWQITENDIFFIENDNQLDFAIGQIQNQKKVGYDSEFAPRQGIQETGGVALIQISTQTQIFLFDAYLLQNNPKFKNFLQTFLTDPQIAKVGHSLKEDINEMSKNYEQLSEKFADYKFLFKEWNFQDIGIKFQEKMGLQQLESLAKMAERFWKKKMSKCEQKSNWIRRPLRKCQIHYAGLDALICLKIDEILEQNQFSEKNYQSSGAVKNLKEIKKDLLQVDGKFKCGKEYEYIWNGENEKKFIVDNMLFKLVKYFRNIGIDTAYTGTSDQNLLVDIAIKEKRIILTKSEKFFRSKQKVPVFYFKDKTKDTEGQFKEVLDFFKIYSSEEFLLSRCVKCNSNQLENVSPETVKKYMTFKQEEEYFKYQFQQCFNCKQIYWQGDAYKRSKQRFDTLLEETQNSNTNINKQPQNPQFLNTNLFEKFYFLFSQQIPKYQK